MLRGKLRRYRFEMPILDTVVTANTKDILVNGLIHGFYVTSSNPAGAVTLTLTVEIDTSTTIGTAAYGGLWTMAAIPKDVDDYILPTQGTTGGSEATAWPDATPIPIDSGNETIIEGMQPARLSLIWSGDPTADTTNFVDVFVEEL